MQQHARPSGMIDTDPASHLEGVPCRMSPDKQHCASRPAISERRERGSLSAAGHTLSHRERTLTAAQRTRAHILSLGSGSVAESGSRSGGRASSYRKAAHQFVGAAPPRPTQWSLPWLSQVRAKPLGVQGSGEGLQMGLLCPQRATGLA